MERKVRWNQLSVSSRFLRTGQWPPLPLPLGVSMDDILFLQQHEYWPEPSKETIKVLVASQVIPTASRDEFERHCSKRRNFVGESDLATEENHLPHDDIVKESAATSCSLPEKSLSNIQEEEPAQSLASLDTTTAASSPSTIDKEPQPLVFLEEDLTTTSTPRKKDKKAPKKVTKLRRSKRIAALKRKKARESPPTRRSARIAAMQKKKAHLT